MEVSENCAECEVHISAEAWDEGALRESLICFCDDTCKTNFEGRLSLFEKQAHANLKN